MIFITFYNKYYVLIFSFSNIKFFSHIIEFIHLCVVKIFENNNIDYQFKRLNFISNL